MEQHHTVTVRMFGIFHTLRQERGLAPRVTLPLPLDGTTALELARQLALPLEMVGAVYCNHSLAGLGRIIRPGDRIAFVPKGVPGPHQCLQGFPQIRPEEQQLAMAEGFRPAPLPLGGAEPRFI